MGLIKSRYAIGTHKSEVHYGALQKLGTQWGLINAMYSNYFFENWEV